MVPYGTMDSCHCPVDELEMFPAQKGLNASSRLAETQ